MKMIIRNLAWMSFAFIVSSCVTLKPQQLSNNGVTGQKLQPLSKEDLPIQEMDHWYLCNQENMKVINDSGRVKISINSPMGDCFGFWFDSMDVSGRPLVALNMKFRAHNMPKQTLGVLAGFSDCQKAKTYEPTKNMILNSEEGFKEYIFDYNQEVLTNKDNFAYTKVNSILIFLNITGENKIDGELLIKGIRFIKSPK